MALAGNFVFLNEAKIYVKHGFLSANLVTMSFGENVMKGCRDGEWQLIRCHQSSAGGQ